jgi:hypothetical protein
LSKLILDKIPHGGLVLGLSQLSQLPQVSQKKKLATKMEKMNLKESS